MAQETSYRAPAGAGLARSMPNDLKVERAVLSAILQNPRAGMDEVIGYLGANAEVFYDPIHQLLFSTLLDLSKTSDNVDLVVLAHTLEQNKRLEEIGGMPFLAALYGEVPTDANLEAWCRILKEAYTVRQVIKVCNASLLKCFQSDLDVPKLIDEVESDIYGIRNQQQDAGIVELQAALIDRFRLLNEVLSGTRESGISTGYKAIDDLTGGLKKGEMFVVAARPSIGKTAFALNVISNIILANKNPRKVALFSLEMTAGQIAGRILCSQAKVSEQAFWNRTFNTKDMPKLTAAVSAFKAAKLVIDPTAGLTVADLRAKARRLCSGDDPVQVIVIDYLQLMGVDTRIDSRQQQVAEISSGIKQLAKELDIPVLVLAQLNRESEKTTAGTAQPKLSQLRESGAIEQDADIVAFLHRDRDKAKDLPPDEGVETSFIVEKNRNGQIGVVRLNFFPAYTRFEVAAEGKYPDQAPKERN